MDLLNSNRNLVGVDTRINSLKNRGLQVRMGNSDPPTPNRSLVGG
jgi:hypothetical protein